VRIELDDTAAAAELVGFLRSFDCEARPIGAHLVEVEFEQPRERSVPASLDRIRLDAFVRVWNTYHPAAVARLLDDQRVASL
jgi:hypothetical protein